MATETTVAGRVGRFGWAALRCAAAGIVVLLVLGATLGTAGAEDTLIIVTNVKLSKADFIKGCLEETNGVNILTEFPDGNMVLCEHEDGSYTSCNFEAKVCWSGFYPGQSTAGTHGTAGGGAATDGGGSSGGQRPTAATRGTTGSGTVLVDDERR